jgi:hypothetical protein
MTPGEYRAARARASHWVQLRIDAVTPPPALPGMCLLRGEVTRLFRGAPPAERTIELAVECKKRGQRSPPGDEFRMDLGTWRVAATSKPSWNCAMAATS